MQPTKLSKKSLFIDLLVLLFWRSLVLLYPLLVVLFFSLIFFHSFIF